MPKNKDLNAHNEHAQLTKSAVSETDSPVPVLLQFRYTHATEAIGAMVQELIKARGYFSVLDLQLMLTVRLELCTEESQRNIMQEALILVADKSVRN